MTSHDKKIIQINPDFFSLKKTKSKSRKQTPKNHKPLFNPSSIRKKLIEKIKKHRKENEKSNLEENNDILDIHKPEVEKVEKVEKKKKPETKMAYTGTFNKQDDFKETLDYLENIATKHHIKKEKKRIKKIQKQKNKTLKNIENIIKNDPPYGILKGGKKPLYSHYKKTMKNKASFITDFNNKHQYQQQQHQMPQISNIQNQIVHTQQQPKINIQESSILMNTKPYNEIINIPEETIEKQENQQLSILQKRPTILSWREKQLENLKNKIKMKREEKHKKQFKKTIKKYKKIKHYTGTYGNKVRVLTKNKRTIKNEKQILNKIHKTKIYHIKKYLRENGFIKYGTDAPDELLRDMYENLVISGEIKNKNYDKHLYNLLYLKENENDEIKN